jgi:hypothetical protein
MQRGSIAFASVLQTFNEQLLGGGIWRFELQRPQRTDLRQQTIEEGQEPVEQPWPLVADAVALFVILSRHRKQKTVFGDSRHEPFDFFLLVLPRGARQFRNQLADCVPVRSNRQVFVEQKHVVQLEAVGVAKRPLEQRLGDFEADVFMIDVRRIRSGRGLDDVEREFHQHVRRRRLRVRNVVPVLGLQLREHQRDRAVHCFGMPGVVGRVMGERAERERVLVQIARVANDRFNEIAAAHVVQQVAEEMAAERVVAEILNDRAAVGVLTRLPQVCRSRAWKLLRQYRLDRAVPQRIDRRLVREHRIRGRRGRNKQRAGCNGRAGQESPEHELDGCKRRAAASVLVQLTTPVGGPSCSAGGT